VKFWQFSRVFHRTSWKSHSITGSKDASGLPQIQGIIIHRMLAEFNLIAINLWFLSHRLCLTTPRSQNNMVLFHLGFLECGSWRPFAGPTQSLCHCLASMVFASHSSKCKRTQREILRLSSRNSLSHTLSLFQSFPNDRRCRCLRNQTVWPESENLWHRPGSWHFERAIFHGHPPPKCHRWNMPD